MKNAYLVLLALFAATCSGCTRGTQSPPLAPSQTTTTTVPVTVTVLNVTIGGVVPLTSIGQTSQLTATARYSDNSTKDVTAEGAWNSGDLRVVSVSPSGLMTVAGFGGTYVSFNYQQRFASTNLTATPPGTFVIRGRVREPAAGGLSGFRVVDTMSGKSGVTDVDGEFSLAELPRLQAHLKIDQSGFEPVEVDVSTAAVDLPMQRVIRVTAGATASVTLAPNDLSYVVGGRTCLCRLIRVVSQTGTLHVRGTWNVTSNLILLVDGQTVAGQTRELTADIPVNAPREVIMYLGAASAAGIAGHTAVTLETSMR